MKQIKIYLLLSIVINFAMICCGFLVGKFDGEFVNGMRLGIVMRFIGAPNKYLVHAIDSGQNRFSIKTSKTFDDDDNKLIIDFNGLTCDVSTNSTFLDGTFGLLIIFVFEQNNLYYRYRYLSNSLLLSNISNSNSNRNKQITSSSSRSDWPDAGDLDKLSNQTKIWFGYSNKIINNDNSDSDWSTNPQIIGCIRWVAVNYERIKLEMRGKDNFYNYCWINDAIESICQDGICRNGTIYYYFILDCKYRSISEMNTAQHCYRDLSINSDLLNSYERIGDDTKSIIVKIAWITKQSINQCLMEIITRNNSLIEINMNSFNQITLAIKHDKSGRWSKNILYEISSNQIHILRIEFTESNSIFKVSNGKFIKTLILPKIGSVQSINVGWNFGMKLCQQITTKFVFRYDSKQFRLLNESNTKHFLLKSFNKTRQETKMNCTNNILITNQVHIWIIFLIMIISVLCNILICIVWRIGKIKTRKGNIPRSTLNIYEEPIGMNNLPPSTCAGVIEERNE